MEHSVYSRSFRIFLENRSIYYENDSKRIGTTWSQHRKSFSDLQLLAYKILKMAASSSNFEWREKNRFITITVNASKKIVGSSRRNIQINSKTKHFKQVTKQVKNTMKVWLKNNVWKNLVFVNISSELICKFLISNLGK